MIITDNRTPEQRERLTVAAVGTDPAMSGGAFANGGTSYAAWACRPEHLPDVRAWVESRGDMRRVREVQINGYRPRTRPGFANSGSLHIYAVEPGHPALSLVRWSEVR